MTRRAGKTLIALGTIALLSACFPAMAESQVAPPVKNDGGKGKPATLEELFALPAYDMKPEEHAGVLLRITAGKSRVVYLEQPAAKAVADDPKMLGVFMPTPTTVNVLSHDATGLSRFSVMDAAGATVLQRQVIVVPQSERRQQYLRTKIVCAEGELQNPFCGKDVIYWCNNIECYETHVINADLPTAPVKP